MPSYYTRVDGNLHPGDIAKSEDINNIQTNIEDSIKSVINDLHDYNAFILGENENAFKLTPAPKRYGRYIDTLNIFDKNQYIWLPINHSGYRQAIKKSKTSTYSIICKFQNLNSESILVECRLLDNDYTEINRTKIEIAGNTEGAEYEIIFDYNHGATAPGLDYKDIEPFDTDKMCPPKGQESFDHGPEIGHKMDINDFTVGASYLYLEIVPLNISEETYSPNGERYTSVTDNDFNILADLNGTYGKLLETSKDGLLSWQDMEYDLYFKDIYATNTTYLCEMGEAVIDGQKVKCQDTHVSIDGASKFGNIKSYVYMNTNGKLKAINSPAYFDENADLVTTDISEPHLIIAEITTYMNGKKPAYINQDDTTLRIRRRSHEERLRRLEKELGYTKDIAIPPRLKYSISGQDIVESEPERGRNAIYYDDTKEDGTENAKLIEGSKFFLTTDSQGNFVIKSVDAEVVTIPITLQGDDVYKEDKKDLTGDTEQVVKTIAENKDMTIDTKEGTIKLKSNTSGIGMTDEEAKKTTFNPWDDDASNRPKDKNITPTEREYKVVKGKNGANDWSSEFPAMTFYTNADYKIEGINIPITKFKNCESIKFIIWKRQGPNDKTNTVWLEKRMYTSESFSLAEAKEKDSYQIMEDGFTIKISDGLNLEKGQYVIVCFPTPKSDTGSCFVETYKPENPKDFCIRYYGAGDGSHFLLKERYHEIWYNAASFTGSKTSLSGEGSVTSGTVTWKNEDPIDSILVNANITTPEECEYKLEADTGAGWQELKVDETTKINGGGSSFRWRLTFKGKNDTPVLAYSDSLKYALNFVITRTASGVGNYDVENACITTKILRADDILRDYIGDPNFALDSSRFSNYEFARIWGKDYDSNRMIIDIEASDREEEITTKEITTENGIIPSQTSTFDIFSLIYCDLELEDFNTVSVDYSNYDSQVEYDEHNLRLKLDTENSYNDNAIALFNIADLKPIESSIGTINDNKITINPDSSVDTNQTLFKLQLNNPVNLTKHSGVKIGLKVDGGNNAVLNGLGLYFSSAYEDLTPTTVSDKDYIILEDEEGLLPVLNGSLEAEINYYYGKVIRIEKTKNNVKYITDYQYIKERDGTYTLQQVQNENSFNIYKFPEIKPSSDTQYIEISIDSTAYALQSVKEIGIISLNGETDQNDNPVFSLNEAMNIEVVSIRSIEADYYAIYNPQDGNKLLPIDSTVHSRYEITDHEQSIDLTKETPQKVTQIKIWYNNISTLGEPIAYWPNDSTAKNFKHMGIQIAASCWLPKNALRLNLCSDTKGRNVVYSMDIPTLNYIHYPSKADVIEQTEKDGKTETITKYAYVNLSQAYKKIKNLDVEVGSISLSCTENFKPYMTKLTENTNTNAYMFLYIGKIVLYKAETIPIFHKNLRFKIYNQDSDSPAGAPSIRKIGVVLDYQ